MAHKYGDGAGSDGGFEAGVLANANRGGENVATGALIGALLGASCGFDKLPRSLVDGLSRNHRDQLMREIDKFVETVPFSKL